MADLVGGLSILVADTSRFRELGNAFRQSRSQLAPGDVLTMLFGLALLVLGVWLLSRLAAYHQNRSRSYSPARLFRKLCRAHGLDGASRRLLWSLAVHHHADHPGRLFVDPDCFQASRLPADLAPYARDLAALAKRLFRQG